VTAKEFMDREREVREAHAIYPDLEIGEAYRRYKEDKGETATMLRTDDPTLARAKKVVLRVFRRPCTQPECTGEQVLEGVCEGCVEGKAGYKTKWTCEVCLFRELSKKQYSDWYKELTEGTYGYPED